MKNFKLVKRIQVVLLLLVLLFTSSSYACTFTIELYDDYGDGWNGGAVTVYVNGTAVLSGITLGSGSGPGIHAFTVNTGDQITTSYTAGSWAYENWYIIKDAGGDQIASDGTGGATPSGISTAVPAACPIPIDASMIDLSTCDCPGTNTIVAELQNKGTDTLFSATINWSVDGVAQTDVSWSDTLLFGETAQITLGSFTFSVGTSYEIIASSTNPNGTIDGNTSNDTVTKTIAIASNVVSAFPHTEDWESISPGFLQTYPNGWTSSTSSNPRWEAENSTGGNENSSSTGPFYDHTSEGTAGGMYMYLETSGGSQGSTSYFTSPCFDMEDLSTVNLIFWYHMYGAAMGTLEVEQRIDGEWFSTGWSKTGAQQSSGDDLWLEATVVLNPDASRIRFKGVRGSSYTSDMSIDDLMVWQPIDNDVGVTEVIMPQDALCGAANDTVVAIVRNNGILTQTSIPVKADVTTPTGVQSLTGTLAGPLAKFESDTVKLYLLNTIDPGNYAAAVYTELISDTINYNDTAYHSFDIDSTLSIPHAEDFADNGTNWTLNGMIVGAGHGLTNNAIYVNMNSTISYANGFFNRKIGAVTANSYLTFDYRIVEFAGQGATTLNDDTIQVLISNDCGSTYNPIYTIDTNNHSPSTEFAHVTVPLNSEVGNDITYAVEATWSAGDYYVDIDNIAISEAPVVNLGPDSVVCEGSTVGFDAGAGNAYTYIWMNGTDTVGTNQTILADSAGIYIAYVTNQFGVSSSDTVALTVNALPVITMSPDMTICMGDSALISVTSGANDTITCLWNTGDTDSAIYVSPQLTATYTVTATNQNMCSVMDSVVVSVNALPIVSFAGLEDSYCIDGLPDTLQGTPTGGIFIGNGISGEIFDPAVAGIGTQDITYTYTDSNSCTNIDTQYTVVNALPIITMSPDMAICMGDSTLISATAGVGDTNTYLWNTGDTDSAIYVSPQIETTYIVTATNQNMCSVIDSVVVSVNDLPIVNLGPDVEVCANDSTVLDAGPGFVSYYWSTTQTTQTIVVDTTGYGIGAFDYSVIVTDSNGCANSDTIVVTYLSTPDVSITAPDTSKYTYDLIISATPGFESYLWNTGATTDSVLLPGQTLTFGTDTMFNVIVTDLNGCYGYDTATVFIINDMGIIDAAFDFDIKIYPNPNNGKFKIAIDGYQGVLKMDIYDLNAYLLASETFSVYNKLVRSYDLGTLAKGVYYVKFSNKNTSEILKLIIQ